MKSDEQLEQILRATFATRSDTVTGGPVWRADAATKPGADGPVELLDLVPRRPRYRFAPLAAAAVAALAIVGLVVGIRAAGDRPTRPAAPDTAAPTAAVSDQLPIPSGMKSIDALGVEIFVPEGFAINDQCAHDFAAGPVPFTRPCLGFQGLGTGSQIRIAVNARGTTSERDCVAHVNLAGEDGCVYQYETFGSLPYVQTIAWAQHRVAISVETSDPKLTLRIIESAHYVPTDRNGCGATIARSALPAKTPATSSPIASPQLPNSDSLRLCLYTSHRRLAASAGLAGPDAATVRRLLNGVVGRLDLSCDRVTLAGMYMLVSTAGDRTRTVYVPPCGGRTFANLATAVRQLAHIPIS